MDSKSACSNVRKRHLVRFVKIFDGLEKKGTDSTLPVIKLYILSSEELVREPELSDVIRAL